jgi:RNA polymerase sigma-70 factor, ECF subfamily
MNFDSIVQETQAHVRAYIAGLGMRPHQVDDIAQEVYLDFYRNMEKMPPDLQPIRWLKGIARNMCMNHFRKENRRTSSFQQNITELLAQFDPSSEQEESLDDKKAALRNCLQKLPEKTRQTLTFRYEEGLASNLIAEKLKTSAEAIRIALHRTREVLKTCIESTLREHASES